MSDNEKTKEQLIEELKQLRQRVAQLQGLEQEQKRTAELEQHNVQLQASLDQAQALYDINRDLHAASDEQELLQVLIQPAQQARVNAAVLMYIDLDQDGEPEWLEMAAAWQRESPEAQADQGAPPTVVVPIGARFYLPDFLFSSLWMANPNEPQLIADVTTDEQVDVNFRNLLVQMGTRALAAIPLTVAGRWVGLINLSWDEVHEFGEQEAEIYTALIGLASSAVESHRLFKLTQATLVKARQSEQMLWSVIDATPDWIFIKDQEHRYRLANQGYADTFHLQPADVMGKNDLELGFAEELVKGDPDKGIRGLWTDDRQVMDSGEPLINAHDAMTIDDKLRIFYTIKTPLRDAEGEVWGVLAFARDVTERERLLANMEQNSTQLQTAAEVSRAASSILDPDELIQQVVSLVRKRFDLYYVGLFLADPTEKWAVLRAGTGKAGRKMIKQGHKLEIGGGSMIGSCIASTQARIALDVREPQSNDVGKEAVRFPTGTLERRDNPVLPKTRSEMALPLIARGRAIGAMSIQSTKEAAFSDADVAVLQTMSDQVANAIANARLFEQSQAALDDAQQSEQLLRSIIDATPDLIFVKDRKHRFRLANRGFARALDRVPEDLIGKDDLEMGFAKDRVLGDPEKGIGGFWDDDLMVMDGGEPVHIPNSMVSLGDEQRVMNFIKVPLRDIQGDVWGLLGIGRDVTEREQLLTDLERRSQDLQTAAEVSSAISSILDPDELNQQVVNLVQERFGLYYAGLFLVDQLGEWSGEPGKWAALRAGTGKAGRQMMKRGHKLEIGGDSMIGSCIANAQARIALDVREPQSNDVGEEARRFPTGMLERHDNPLLPKTRSEMALPLIARGQAIGAMSIQSEKEAAFSDADIAVLQTMADQVATAIQNGRLYQESIILYMASQAISQAATVDEALESAARYILSPIYETCALLTFVEAGQHDTMEVLAAWKRRSSVHEGERPVVLALPVGAIVSKKRFPIYDLLARQETTIFNDLLQDDRLSPDAIRQIQASGVQSALSIPLIAGPNWLGVLVAQGPHVTALGPEDRRAFESLAHQLAAFIQSARLLEETQRALREVQRLHRSYISEAWQEYLTTAEETMVADYMFEQRQIIPRPELELREIDLALQENRVITSGHTGLAPLGDDVSSQLSDTAAPAVLGSGVAHSRIVAPISLREQVIGVLGIEDPSGEHVWDEDDIALLEAVSMQLGLAIDNARLSEQTRSSLAETQTLFDTSRGLAAAQGMDAIWQAVADAARTRRIDACALLLFDTLERHTARELVLVSGWDRQETTRLPIGVRLPLSDFGLFDLLQSDQPFPIADLAQADNVDEASRNLISSLGFTASLFQPIAVRERWFGLLTVFYQTPHPFTKSEINFYRTLTDQAALAIEGQRLLTETQQRAEREQLIRQVTEKVHDTPDMETILQTAVQELSKAMGLPRAFVRLGTRETLVAPEPSQQASDGQDEG